VKEKVGSEALPNPLPVFFSKAPASRTVFGSPFAKAEDPELRIVTADAEMNAGEVLLRGETGPLSEK
jgi:hypothetical protein